MHGTNVKIMWKLYYGVSHCRPYNIRSHTARLTTMMYFN